jgi:tetratricopeptide (TPR) repeat protein
MSWLAGCNPRSHCLEPTVTYVPQQRHIEELPSGFAPLVREEAATLWGKELVVGEAFAKELDLYRAITAYKRGLILIPQHRPERTQQLEYSIFLAYYLGHRYQDAVACFENSTALQQVNHDFPAIKELLIALCDSYYRTDQPEKALRVIPLVEALDPALAQSMRVHEALVQGNLPLASEQVRCSSAANDVLHFEKEYGKLHLSVTKAQMLNAVLPGAGYYYVGQTKSAFTSFVINALFSAATYQFFQRGLWAPGLITASLEMGWYIGGINGAGLAAKQYNECLYETRVKETMLKTRLFPVLMFETAF